MKKFIVLGMAVLIIGFALFNLPSGGQTETGEVLAHSVILHKSPTCGCCGVYGTYMKNQGYKVEENNIPDASLSQLKTDLGIPNDLWSCHTSEIDGYIIEGHIPNEAITKLLNEKPDIKGIGMAGMPSGSPGMPGPKEDFLVYQIEIDGSLGELFMQI